MNSYNIEYIGNMDIDITGFQLCNRKNLTGNVLSYVTSSKFQISVLHEENIVCLVLKKADLEFYKDCILKRNGCLIISDTPELLFYDMHEYLYAQTNFYSDLKFSPLIGINCNIDNSVKISNGVIIGDNVSIGANSVILPGSIIDNNVNIGNGVIIGSEGFHIIFNSQNSPLRIHHVGKCHICEGVFIGDNTCVCKNLFAGETYIGARSKIDNLCHIAHNCFIDEDCVLTAGVTLCGSVTIKKFVWMGPNSSVMKKCVVGEHSTIGIGSVVLRNVLPNTTVFGIPAKKIMI